MRTQEEVDAEHYAWKKARREAIAEQAKSDNAKLVAPKEYRGVRYFMNQRGMYVVPDAPKELAGLHTSPSRLHVLIDAYLDRQED
jgi:hypothetical protein